MVDAIWVLYSNIPEGKPWNFDLASFMPISALYFYSATLFFQYFKWYKKKCEFEPLNNKGHFPSIVWIFQPPGVPIVLECHANQQICLYNQQN